ncbi:MAG: transglutaminase-like domain-containing protein, partial [archaeon]|nr:transglutaminase-like domain-containing protein [archaeon]
MTETKERFYRVLLEKYAGIINQNEQRTVGEIKALVDPMDPGVQGLLQEFKPTPYTFERDYLFTAQQVFEHITQEIKYVPNDLTINFWLKPHEILANKVADDEDLAVLVCTVLHALGDENAMVVFMELENLTTHAVVLTTVNGKTLLLDP